MDEEYRKRIGDFLMDYLDITDTSREWKYSDEIVIYQGIAKLLDNGIFSIGGLKREILKKVGVILSDETISNAITRTAKGNSK